MRTTPQKAGLRRIIVLTLAAQGGESAQQYSLSQVRAGSAVSPGVRRLPCAFEVADLVNYEVRVNNRSESGNKQSPETTS